MTSLAATQTFAIADLKPHPLNPNVGDVDAIEESIRTNGWYGVVLVQKSTGFVIAGWHRSLAAGRTGMTDVPGQVLDVDDATALRIISADNETNRRGHYDDSKLVALLSEINEFDTGLIGTGFGDSDLEDLIAATDLSGIMPTPTGDPQAGAGLDALTGAVNLDSPSTPAAPQQQQGGAEPAPDPNRIGTETDSIRLHRLNPDGQRNDALRRIVVLDLPLDRFSWLIEQLAVICDKEGVTTNTEAVMRVVSQYTGSPIPDSTADDD